MAEASSFISNFKDMKKFFLFAGYLLSVAVVFYILDFGCGTILDKYLYLDNDLPLQYAHYGGNGESVVVLGASRAKHHYKPSVIDKETGLTSYNYGRDGRNIFNQYIIANELLSHASVKPKIFILEVASIDIEDTPGWNGEKLSNLFPLYKKNTEVREIVDREDPESGFALKYINLYRYNSSLFDYLKNLSASHNGDILKGYTPLYSEWPDDAEILDESENFSLYPWKEVYLKKLIELSKDNDVKIVFYNSPDFKIVKFQQAWESKIEAICAEYNVSFINHAHDSLFLSHREWFNEPFHLNDKGASEYSSIVAKEINEYIKNE